MTTWKTELAVQPPPRPPQLAAADIAALVEYAQRQASWFEAYAQHAQSHGLEVSADELEQVAGWRFTAQALAEAWG